MRSLVRATLDPGDYAVVEARDGDEALERTRSERPDLIVLDTMIPGRSCESVLVALRDDPASAATPVIVLVARAQAQGNRVKDPVGADRCLTKPFSPLALAALVEELLSSD
jgi:DNA-binding response OmpR family regulator